MKRLAGYALAGWVGLGVGWAVRTPAQNQIDHQSIGNSSGANIVIYRNGELHRLRVDGIMRSGVWETTPPPGDGPTRWRVFVPGVAYYATEASE